jgi:hypothetical protein
VKLIIVLVFDLIVDDTMNHLFLFFSHREILNIQSDHKKTPQLISFLFEIRFQRAVHQIKGFMMYHKLDIKWCP